MNVLVEKNKIDLLANAISDKSGEPVTMTLEEMVEAVDSIEAGGGEPNLQAKTYTVDSAGTSTVTADSGYDGLSSVQLSVPSASLNPWYDGFFQTKNGVRKYLYEYGYALAGNTGYDGWIADNDIVEAEFNAVQSNTSITPTESAQTIGGANYMMEGAVTVNPIPNTYVQPTSTIGATTYRASTSNQTINAGTYHSGAATIAAVSATNLSAENIKSGTTISISNGQSNIWSVTGTYTGSGGSANFGTVTMTNSSNQNTSISFTLPSGRTPKAFFCRLTTQITRNSSSRYYYVENIRWDGSTTGGIEGRCFYMYSGQLTNITSGYSKSQSGTTYTLTSTGSRSASPGSFYNGTYELVYVY